MVYSPALCVRCPFHYVQLFSCLDHKQGISCMVASTDINLSVAGTFRFGMIWKGFCSTNKIYVEQELTTAVSL